MAIRWKALGTRCPDAELERGYLAALFREERLRLGADCLFWQKPLGSVEYLPYADAERAYIREEERLTAMGCRRMKAPIASLAFRLKSGEVKLFEVGRRDMADRALEALSKLETGLEFGFQEE